MTDSPYEPEFHENRSGDGLARRDPNNKIRQGDYAEADKNNNPQK